MNKSIDLSRLPVFKNGTNKGKINWKESIGYKCKFKYDNIEGEIEIIDYNKNNRKLTIKYLDYDLFEILYSEFKKCRFGKLLKKKTNEFKVEIGQTFKDNKRDLIIINKKYKKDKKGQNYKYYKYKCNKCKNEDWIEESNLIHNHQGCNTCCKQSKKVIQGVNDIYTTDYWMIELGVNIEYAKKYTSQSSKKIKVKCPNCGKINEVILSNVYKTKSIGCNRGDGISYPEKFVSSLLNQLNIEYITQYCPDWIKPKRYDFYFKLNNKKYIVETHGDFHYNEKGYISKRAKTLLQEQENDKYKKELALSNEIDYYIELDCRDSNLDYIKNSIINSELNKIFDLLQINWLKCEEFALSNRVKEVCDYWRLHNDINNKGLTTKDLSKVFNLHSATISRYLKRGNKLGWCNYNPKNESLKRSSKFGKINGKQVEIFKNGKSLGVFESCHELERQSEELFGVKLLFSNISEVARNKKEQYKGFTFKYVLN